MMGLNLFHSLTGSRGEDGCIDQINERERRRSGRTELTRPEGSGEIGPKPPKRGAQECRSK